MLKVGLKAPNFNLPNTEGKMVQLSEFLGQNVYVMGLPWWSSG